MISGPAPKEDPIRRNKPIYSQSQIQWDGLERGIDLPNIEQLDSYGEVHFFEWHSRTREWWASWRNSAQAMVMHDSDWESMLETAMLHTRYWNGGLKATEQVAVATALKSRMAAYGATYEDRLKLRMVIKTDLDEQIEELTIKKDAEAAINYMERLAEAAAPKEKP